jgi:hypothetical protein
VPDSLTTYLPFLRTLVGSALALCCVPPLVVAIVAYFSVRD